METAIVEIHNGSGTIQNPYPKYDDSKNKYLKHPDQRYITLIWRNWDSENPPDSRHIPAEQIQGQQREWFIDPNHPNNGYWFWTISDGLYELEKVEEPKIDHFFLVGIDKASPEDRKRMEKSAGLTALKDHRDWKPVKKLK